MSPTYDPTPHEDEREERAHAVADQRIAYGSRCTWWDSIDKVGRHESGLPCCPHCKGMLFETKSIELWWESVDRFERDGNPGYRKLMEWLRGRCFFNLAAAQAAFVEAH